MAVGDSEVGGYAARNGIERMCFGIPTFEPWIQPPSALNEFDFGVPGYVSRDRCQGLLRRGAARQVTLHSLHAAVGRMNVSILEPCRNESLFKVHDLDAGSHALDHVGGCADRHDPFTGNPDRFRPYSRVATCPHRSVDESFHPNLDQGQACTSVRKIEVEDDGLQVGEFDETAPAPPCVGTSRSPEGLERLPEIGRVVHDHRPGSNSIGVPEGF